MAYNESKEFETQGLEAEYEGMGSGAESSSETEAPTGSVREKTDMSAEESEDENDAKGGSRS